MGLKCWSGAVGGKGATLEAHCQVIAQGDPVTVGGRVDLRVADFEVVEAGGGVARDNILAHLFVQVARRGGIETPEAVEYRVALLEARLGQQLTPGGEE